MNMKSEGGQDAICPLPSHGSGRGWLQIIGPVRLQSLAPDLPRKSWLRVSEAPSWWERGRAGKGRSPCQGHRPGPKMRAMRPRVSTRPSVEQVAARVGAWLWGPALHRSSWQQSVEAAPLLTWPCRWYEGVQDSSQLFSTRFPRRGSTGDGGVVKLESTPNPRPPSTSPASQVPHWPHHHGPSRRWSPPPGAPGRAPGCPACPRAAHLWSRSCRSGSWLGRLEGFYSWWSWSTCDSGEPRLGDGCQGLSWPPGGLPGTRDPGITT